jgi:CheY-like chemotaxis protein
MEKVGMLCLVDDDIVFQFLTQKVIEETGLVNQVKFFSNGFEAIEFLKDAQENIEKLPDIILLDLFMPVMDGWGFLDAYIKLKPRLGKKITIYIVSSSIDPADIKKAKSISAVTDFIIKPITKEKFTNLMESL